MSIDRDPLDRDPLDREDLSAYIDGELSAAETAQVGAELERDPALRRDLAQLEELSAAIRDLPTLRAPASVLAGVRHEITPPAAVGFHRFGSWAALFLVAMVGLIWVGLEATRTDRDGAPGEAGPRLAKEEGALESEPSAEQLNSFQKFGNRDELADVVGGQARDFRQPDQSAPSRELAPASRSEVGRSEAAASEGVRSEVARSEVASPEGASTGGVARGRGLSSEERTNYRASEGDLAEIAEEKIGRPAGVEVRSLAADQSDSLRRARTTGTTVEKLETAARKQSLAKGESEEVKDERGIDFSEVLERDNKARLADLDAPGDPGVQWRLGLAEAADDEPSVPADLTIRIPVPDTIGAGELMHLADLLAGTAVNEAKDPAGRELADSLKRSDGGASAPERRPGQVDRDETTPSDELSAGAAGSAAESKNSTLLLLEKKIGPRSYEEWLPAEVEFAVADDRLLPMIEELRNWRRSLSSVVESAPEPGQTETRRSRAAGAPPSSTPAPEAGSTEPTNLTITILDGISFDTDARRLSEILATLVVDSPVGEPVRSQAAKENRVDTESIEIPGRERVPVTNVRPLRLRIILVLEEPGESRR